MVGGGEGLEEGQGRWLRRALAVTNQDGGSLIEAYESRKSYEKIGNFEQSKFF